MIKLRKITALCLAAVLVLAMSGCSQNTENTEDTTTGSAVGTEQFDSQEIKAYKEYLAERENVSDLYFSYMYIGEHGQAVLAITHEKNAVNTADGYITASHIVLNNYVDGKVVQVSGSSMDSYSNTAEIAYADGKMWVPFYGGVGSFAVNTDKIEGNVYTTEAGSSMTYQVTGKKKSEPKETDADTVAKMTKQLKETAIPLKFYKNTAENREKYL